MAQAMANNISPSDPNSSIPSNMEVRGQFTTAQKKHTRPTAALVAGSSPIRFPSAHPKVEPMKNAGTISPPRKPQPIVTQVNNIFSKNA